MFKCQNFDSTSSVKMIENTFPGGQKTLLQIVHKNVAWKAVVVTSSRVLKDILPFKFL